MKRIIYILAVVMAMAIALGGVSTSASYTADNLTRGGTCAVLDAGQSPEIGEESMADGVETVADGAETVADGAETVVNGTENSAQGVEENVPADGAGGDTVDKGANSPDASADTAGDGAPVNEAAPADGAGENVTPDVPDENTDKSGDVSQNGGISEENGTNSDADSTIDNAVDGEGENNTAGDADGVESDADGEANEAGDTEPQNPFAMMFDTVKDYATEIFCSLSLVCSLVLAYCYKRGLIPLLTGGLNSLSGVIKSVKESTERGEGETRELAKIVTARLCEAESALDIITASIGDLSARLDALSEDKQEKEQMKVILGAQVDMLYSIFMTSALPQYQKDEVGARIAAMREALGLLPAKGGAAVEGE